MYADENCLVINKRCGEAVGGTRGAIAELPYLLGDYCGVGGFQPVAAHRLDVPVSGACVFARNPESAAFLSDAFARGLTEKYYWAVLEKPSGAFALPESGTLTHWITADGKRNKSFAHSEAVSDSKKGELRYRILGYGERYFFMEIQLITGRHHQIRCQLAAEGLRIKGDLKYGASRSEPSGGIKLHSRRIAFPDPARSGERICVSAPPPSPDKLWSICEGFSSF
ncbi:MAG: RNA pseudouridine synthase [Spirochaetaceae bacterium]|nr:RNA pseudouridine synthase [Spirochaetaceae bacterium]